MNRPCDIDAGTEDGYLRVVPFDVAHSFLILKLRDPLQGEANTRICVPFAAPAASAWRSSGTRYFMSCSMLWNAGFSFVGETSSDTDGIPFDHCPGSQRNARV